MNPGNLFKETERLILRPLKNEDHLSWFTGITGRMPVQHKYDIGPEAPEECTLNAFQSIIKNINEDMESDRYYCIAAFLKNSNHHIGKIDLTILLRGEFQWGLIGYTVHNNFQGNGYGTEMLNAGLDLSFKSLMLKRVEAHINIDNDRSIKLAEKAGMSFENVRKKFIYEYGDWTDNAVFVKLNSEFTGEPERFI